MRYAQKVFVSLLNIVVTHGPNTHQASRVCFWEMLRALNLESPRGVGVYVGEHMG